MCPRQRLSKACRGRSTARVIVLLALLAGAPVVGGCALNADFDRVRPSLVTEDMHAWVGRDAVREIGLPPSEFGVMTDDERALRGLAYAMIAPPYDRARWDSVFREYGLGRPAPREPVRLDPGAYWRRLNEYWRRSEASAYSQLMTDARNDTIRIDPFFAIAGRVADMDRKRGQVVAVAAKSGPEYENALFRNNENTAIVAWVCRSLRERTSAYGYALERLVIHAPSPMAADTERELSMLSGRIAQYCQSGIGAVLVSKG
jgi:hypothetical protein